ncbi:Heterokaryon incompatibility protein (HET) domain containing protein [Naviculisporaceae sp. PSN 640]
MSSSSTSPTSSWESTKVECDICCAGNPILSSVTVDALTEGEEDGCELCAILHGAVARHAPGHPQDETISLCFGLGIYEMVVGGSSPDKVKISVYGHDRPEAALRFAYEFKGMDNPPPASSHADIIGDMSSPAALVKIREWIEECDCNHESCTLEEPATLPTRVINVGMEDDKQIELYESSGEVERYVCLSHCWGGHQPLQTTKSTLEARKQSISWDDMPKTFQDAISMTRRLGIRYLWIDSLCIIQDDEDDWQQESAKMHTIYQGGYLTLAASWGSGPDSGLFRDIPTDYRLSDWDLDGQHIRTRRKIPHIDSWRDHPLMRRGWVFQERVLSRRVLHFTAAELAWECMSDYECECGEFGQVLGIGDYELASKGRYRPATDKSKLWLYFVWWKVVMDYSKTQLTRDEDVFPALSGVAQLQMAARSLLGSKSSGGSDSDSDQSDSDSGSGQRDVEYYAGLWSDSLIYDLLWHVPKKWGLPILEWKYEVAPRPSEWRAPSWSWASVKSVVQYELLTGFESTLDHLEAEIETTGDNETGQLESAALTVSGTIVEATLHKAVTKDQQQLGRKCVLRVAEMEIDFEEDYDLWAEPPYYGYYTEEGEEVHCLLLGKWYAPEPDPGEGTNKADDKLWFMVLKLVESEGFYERIGVATIPLPKDGEEAQFEERYQESNLAPPKCPSSSIAISPEVHLVNSSVCGKEAIEIQAGGIPLLIGLETFAIEDVAAREREGVIRLGSRTKAALQETPLGDAGPGLDFGYLFGYRGG